MNKKQKKTFIFMLGGIVLLTIIYLCLKPISFKMTKDNMPPNSVYSSSLGTVVQLGMDKKQVDNLLGEGKLEFEQYIYQPDNLAISYKDGKVYSISLQYPNTDWFTKNKFGIGTTKNTIISVYGNTRAENENDELIYGFDNDDKLLPSNTGVSYGVLYAYGIDNKVKAFTIEKVE